MILGTTEKNVSFSYILDIRCSWWIVDNGGLRALVCLFTVPFLKKALFQRYIHQSSTSNGSLIFFSTVLNDTHLYIMWNKLHHYSKVLSVLKCYFFSVQLFPDSFIPIFCSCMKGQWVVCMCAYKKSWRNVFLLL